MNLFSVFFGLHLYLGFLKSISRVILISDLGFLFCSGSDEYGLGFLITFNLSFLIVCSSDFLLIPFSF